MPRPHNHVIFTDLNGVEGVLVDLNTRQYFQLNETACLIWRGLAKGTPAADIARELTELYDVTLDHAQASVEASLARFSAHRLLDSTP
jgi:Coenzyme PQQ synthesis protein D (PqqD)